MYILWSGLPVRMPLALSLFCFYPLIWPACDQEFLTGPQDVAYGEMPLWSVRLIWLVWSILWFFVRSNQNIPMRKLTTLELLKPEEDPVEYIHRTTALFTHKLWSSRAAVTITFFAAVNYNYDCKRRTVKHWNTQNGTKFTNHNWTMTFWIRWSKLLFSKRSAKMQKMTDGSEVGFWTLEFVCFWEAQLKKKSPVLVIRIQGRKLKQMHFIHRSWSTWIFTTISCTQK